MTATVKLLDDGEDQLVLLPDEFRIACEEVRISKVGDKVILEPLGKEPFDAAAWLAQLDRYRGIPFMENGRDQGTILDQYCDRNQGGFNVGVEVG